MSKDVVVKINEEYGKHCLEDKTFTPDNSIRKPEGYVEIYDIDDKGNLTLIGKHNLVVYCGREWLATRIFNTENPNIDSTAGEFISWVGVGTGGAPVGDPLNPTAPTNYDTDLDTEVMINATDPLCADVRVDGRYKHPIDSITFDQDSNNGWKYLIVNATTTIGIDDANGNNISEAGLFASSSRMGGYSGNFTLFARITHPTVVKESSRQIIYVWYLYV